MSTAQDDRLDRLEAEENTADITLLEGERVLKNQLPSWVNWWKLLVLAVLIGLLGVAVIADGSFGAGLFFLLIAGIAVGYVRYARKISRYIVTNQRVKKSVGLVRKSTGETRIAKIRGLSTNQGLIERLIGKGSVLIDSGAASGKLGIQGVSNHEELANTIREQQRRIEGTEQGS